MTIVKGRNLGVGRSGCGGREGHEVIASVEIAAIESGVEVSPYVERIRSPSGGVRGGELWTVGRERKGETGARLTHGATGQNTVWSRVYW